MIRAVLDTNVIVSGIIKGSSPPGRLLAALFQGRFTAATSPAILTEVSRVLAYPKIHRRYHIASETAESLLISLALVSDLIGSLPFQPRVSRDPQDDIFISCAAEGNADYIVTGDQDLLVLKKFRGIHLVSPENFLRLIKK